MNRRNFIRSAIAAIALTASGLRLASAEAIADLRQHGALSMGLNGLHLMLNNDSTVSGWDGFEWVVLSKGRYLIDDIIADVESGAVSVQNQGDTVLSLGLPYDQQVRMPEVVDDGSTFRVIHCPS